MISPGPDYVTTNFILNKIPRLSKRQLDYWASAGYVASWNPSPGPGRVRWFHREEFGTIFHMEILVNQLGFAPDKAAEIALVAKDNLDVKDHKGRLYTWVTNAHVIIELPIALEI